MAESDRGLYIIGPLVPDGVGNTDVGLSRSAKALELASSDNGAECEVFMDKMLEKHGNQCLIYVSTLSLGEVHIH